MISFKKKRNPIYVVEVYLNDCYLCENSYMTKESADKAVSDLISKGYTCSINVYYV